MVKSILEIAGVSVGFSEELPVSQNMSVADVREPGKANATFTKTLLIPGSPEIKKIFEYIFHVNSELTNFNPALKTPAKYYVNEILVFDGALQLLRINNKYVTDYVSTEFECSLIGVNANLFTDIAGKYLTDIDYSDLDHTFSYASGLFVPALIGTGYVYGYQDYGVNPTGQRLTDEWYFKYLKPLIFEREYVSRIIKYAGYYWDGAQYVNSAGDVWATDSYTLTSGGYFDTDHEKHIVIPDTKSGRLQLAASDIADNEAYIGRSGTYTGATKSGAVPFGSDFYRFYTANEIIETNIPYNDEASPYFDPNGRWDPVTDFEFTTNQQGVYYLFGSVTGTYNILTFPATTTEWQFNAGALWLIVEVLTSTDNGATWNTVGAQLTKIIVGRSPIATDTFNFTVSVANPTVSLNAGDLVRIQLKNSIQNNITFYDVSNNKVTAGTAEVNIDVLDGSEFRAKMAFPELDEGQTVRMNSTIPENITQLDFLTSIIRLENLYFEPSKSIARQYVCETREDFINLSVDDAEDWTDKWDISKDQEIIPMGELDWNRLTFVYKQDQDHYNKKYLDKYKEVYGSEMQDVENDFVKKEKKIEVVFSATPIAGTPVNDIVAPRYLNMEEDTGVVKPLKCNIRRLYWGGLINCQNHNFVYNGVDHDATQYPFVGHVDNPTSPTVDLCWDNPLELYWFYPGNLYSDNNRVNERWSKYIDEITDPNSKIVREWFYLTESDIFKFSFRNLVFVRDAYYLVNKIIDYNPQTKSVTQVEMLKLKAGTVFVPDNEISLDDLGGEDDVTNADRMGNVQNGTGTIVGTGNYNNGAGVVIFGDNNVVS